MVGYTTALAPSLAAGALEGLKKILENKEWGNELLSSAKIWKDEIIKNFSFPIQGDYHILSIIAVSYTHLTLPTNACV